jgi:iron complex outermembrane recepter protein
MSTSFNSPRLAAAGLSFAAIIACPAGAETPQPAAAGQPAEAPTLQEIVVTAQRREERLQDVPISITALTQDALQSRQITDVKSLAAAVPNVTFAQTPQDPTDISISMRGLFLQPAHIVFDPVVGVYVDGVYISRTSGANTGFVDMERVEVLRGPQGTLFGRNTIGGALNITTKRPSDHFEASALAELGDYQARNFTGVVNLPISAGLLDSRFVYQHLEHAGYGTSTITGSDLSDLKQDYARGSLLFNGTGVWNALLSADYLSVHNHSQFVKLGYVVPGSAADVLIPTANGNPADRASNYVGGDLLTNSAQFDPRIQVKVRSATATAQGAVGPVQLKSITGYRDEDANRPGDNDGTPYPIFELPTKPFEYHQFSQELQAYGKAFDDRFNWITGLYYFREHGRQGQTVAVLQPLSAAAGLNDAVVTNRSQGAYAQADYEIVPKVRLTAGVRDTKDLRQVVYLDKAIVHATGAIVCNVAPAIRDAPGLCQATPPEGDFKYWPWTAGLEYEPTPEALIYGKVSKGFRSGGFLQGGAASAVQLQPYGPESLLSDEVGTKLQMLDRRLRLNAAAFYSTYDAIQQTTFVPGPGGLPVGITANVGSARLYGGELEITALIEKLQLHGGLGYVDPKYTKGPLAATNTPFIQVSKVTWSAGAEYPFSLPTGTVRLNLDYVWQSTQHFFAPTTVSTAAVNAAATAATTQVGYGLLNARISYDLRALPLTVALWGRNLANKRYIVRAADYVTAGLGIIPQYPGDPRTYGVSLSYRFGEE